MSSVRKSVKLILQNSTFELLTIEGFDVVLGEWAPNQSPQQGGTLPMQSSQGWKTESQEGGVGTSGYIRLGSTKGYLNFEWDLPWCSDLKLRVKSPEMLKLSITINKELPDFPVVLVNITTIEAESDK